MSLIGCGTKVFTKKNNEVVIVSPRQAGSYKPSKDQSEIEGITKVEIDIPCDDIIIATLYIHSDFGILEATPIYYVNNPATGKTQAVRKIEFENGEVWNK